MADERKRLVQALTLLERFGIVDFNGHASLRRADGTILIHSGRSVRSALTAADIVAVDPTGALVEGEAPPPLELHIHTEIYRRRSDVAAIVHGHPKASTLLTMTGRPYQPVFAQGALLGPLPVLADKLSVNTAERGAALAEALGQGRGVLLSSHGAVVVGADIVEAFVLAVYLEQNAERQIAAAPLGDPAVFSEDEIAACRRNLEKRGLYEKCWNYYAAKFGVG